MVSGGLLALKEMLEQLKPSERKVAEYIMANPHEIVSISIQKLAELSGVSEATIVRLCQRLNMKGFQDLKLRVAGDLASSQLSGGYEEIRMEGPLEQLMQSISNNNKQSIDDTLTVLSAEEVRKAADALSHARRIAVFGMGASFIIAEDLRQKLVRIGCWCEAYPDFHGQLTAAVNLGPGDVAFGVSYSGQTVEIVESIKEAKQQGATIITLTKFGKFPVNELADIKLFVSSAEQSIRSGAMASRIAQLNVIDILFITIASSRKDEVIPLLEKTRLAVNRTKKS